MARIAKLAAVPFRSIVVVPKFLTYHLIDGVEIDAEPGDVQVVPEVAGRVLNSDKFVIPAAVVAGLREGTDSTDTPAAKK